MPIDGDKYPSSTADQLHLWIIEAVAAPNDSRWQGRQIWDQLVVRAPTSGLARLAAERWALTQLGNQRIGNESPSPRAGLLDEKLYWARRVSATSFGGHSVLEVNGVNLVPPRD